MREGLDGLWDVGHKDFMNRDSKEVAYSQIDLPIYKYDVSREDYKSKCILVPRATILLTCGRDRELWPNPIF